MASARGARRDVLERMSFDLLHRPALGGQIVAQLCAIETPSPNDEGLLELLGAGLDAARIASENGKARGQTCSICFRICSSSFRFEAIISRTCSLASVSTSPILAMLVRSMVGTPWAAAGSGSASAAVRRRGPMPRMRLGIIRNQPLP
jgi:hypothetical protein